MFRPVLSRLRQGGRVLFNILTVAILLGVPTLALTRLSSEGAVPEVPISSNPLTMDAPESTLLGYQPKSGDSRTDEVWLITEWRQTAAPKISPSK
jgi:hypothetical protein